MEEARALAEKAGVARSEEDVVTTAIYPITGLQFLKWKYGLEEPPVEVKPLSLEQAKAEQDACDITCKEMRESYKKTLAGK